MRRGDTVLMVHQQAPGEDAGWHLPGGRVEDGELLHEALAREVAEETGLQIGDPGSLAWVSQHELQDAKWGGIYTAFAFDVPAPDGEPQAQDPDGIVKTAAWVPVAEALEYLRAVAFSPMREPVVGYLTGSTGPGHLWLWRLGTDRQAAPLLSLAASFDFRT